MACHIVSDVSVRPTKSVDNASFLIDSYVFAVW